MPGARVSDTKKKTGRPATGQGTPIVVRLQPNDLELLDLWIAANDTDMSRPEALRTMLRMAAIKAPKQ